MVESQLNIKVANFIFNIPENVDGIQMDLTSGSRLFFCGSGVNAAWEYTTHLILCSVHDFPSGDVLYNGEPWGDIQMPYRWFVQKIDEKTAVKVCFDGHHQLNWAMVVLDFHAKSLTYYFDVIHRPILFDPFLYPLGILALIYLAHQHEGLVVHASGVFDGEKGYLFTGLSGIGKSTMARLWLQQGAVIINDDRLVIMPDNGSFTIHNTPMPYYVDVPKQATLKGIFLLSQSPENYCRPVSGAVAMMRFMANCMQHLHSDAFVKEHLVIVEAIASKVPIFELGFKPDSDVVELVRHLNL